MIHETLGGMRTADISFHIREGMQGSPTLCELWDLWNLWGVLPDDSSEASTRGLGELPGNSVGDFQATGDGSDDWKSRSPCSFSTIFTL